MRISELAQRSGVPLATIKYYLRERLLKPGEATSATQATYDESHLKRLALVRTLIEVAGLPVAKVKVIVTVIDEPGPSPFDDLGRALGALPPYGASSQDDYPRARHALEVLGQVYDPGYVSVAHLESALAGLEAAGRPLTDEQLVGYGTAMRTIAEREVASMGAGDHETDIEYAVLGTVLHEPLILALRRLAHQDLYAADHT